MDKTGTLTDNVFALEYIHIADGVDKGLVEKSIIAYIKSGGKSSQTIEAIEKVYTEVYDGTIICDLSFPSSRQFGAVKIKDEFGERVILAGAPDVFLPYLTRAEDKAWVQKYLDTEAVIGKRLICLAQSESMMLSEHLDGIKLQGLAIFTLSNNLREGVKEAVTFFQERGVIIRIISGDNPKTVVATATTAGVQGTEMVVIGSEMEGWSDVDYLKNVHQFRIFARIKPEQKEKIIVALKQDGFTAMIGDGANDALAIKKADLGIAMFDGAQATRQLAPVVLVRNSFADLPDGVRFADSVIQNIEIFASIFFNQTFVGFFFFMILTMFGYSFPFTPLNITFVNYFTVGLPGFFIFYWILQPVYKDTFKESKSFLRQVIPFALISAVPQAIIATFAYFSSLEHIKVHGPTSLVVVSIIILGVLFFMHTPMVYSGPTTKLQKKQLVLMIVVEIISVVIFINIKPIAAFYNLSVPSLHSVLELVPMIVLYAAIQYWITGKYFAKRITPVS
jgi:cation-transporting ATPase E